MSAIAVGDSVRVLKGKRRGWSGRVVEVADTSVVVVVEVVSGPRNRWRERIRLRFENVAKEEHAA